MNESGPIRPVIELRRNGRAVATYSLDAGRLSIGRSPSNDIRLDHLAVTRRHAAIERRPDGSFVLIDLQSRGGTRLDGRQVTPHEPVPLADLSSIRLVDYELVFHHADLVAGEGQDDRLMILKSLRVPAAPVPVPCESAARTDVWSGAYRRLLEVSRILGAGSNLAEQLERALDDLLARFPGAEGGIILAPDQNGDLVSLARSHRDRAAGTASVALSSSLAWQALNASEAMLVAEVPTEPPLDDWDIPYLEPIRAWLCVPLPGLEGRPIGLIQLFSLPFRINLGALQLARIRWQENAVVQHPGSIPLQPDDLDRLAGLTQALGLAIEFQRLEPQAGDAACRQIQASLDHAACRELAGYDFAALFVPGREFQGNFREFIPRVPDGAGGATPPGGTVVMGEVAAKGLRAALIMADVQLEIRRLVRGGVQLPAVLSQVNWLLVDAGGEGNRVCVTLVDIDSRAHRLTAIKAGHDPLVVRRAVGPVEILGGEQDAVGPPLGSSPAPVYRTFTTSLAPGDYVFLTSNASTRYLDFSGPQSVRWRQRAAIHPPGADVALFSFGRKYD